MNDKSLKAAKALVPSQYIKQGEDARRTHEKQVQILLEQVASYMNYYILLIHLQTKKARLLHSWLKFSLVRVTLGLSDEIYRSLADRNSKCFGH